jgi:protein TonB
MADRNPRNAPPPNPLMKFLPIVIIVVALAIGAFLFFGSRGGKAPAPTPGAPQPTAESGAAPEAAAPAAPPPVVEMTKEQLLKEASSAMHENRLVTPAGNNAFEYYERLLEKEPNNQTAKDALRESFPIVIGVPEQDINAGSLDEATRVIDLLAKADPANYTLTILRGKLDAKKKQAEKETAATAAAAAKATAAQAAAAAPAAAPTAAAPPPATTTPKPAPAPAPVAPPPVETPVAAAPAGESHSAQLVKSAAPEYPPEAYRQRKEGWVEVEFTVDANGNVTDPKVANAEPKGLFNNAALAAVKRWTFKPRMENGKAVEERMSRRIVFKF